MFWKETLNHCIPRMMMTPKGRFTGETTCGDIVFRSQTKQSVVKLQEGGSVRYFPSDVSWRIRKGVSCLRGKTGGRKSLRL